MDVFAMLRQKEEMCGAQSILCGMLYVIWTKDRALEVLAVMIKRLNLDARLAAAQLRCETLEPHPDPSPFPFYALDSSQDLKHRVKNRARINASSRRIGGVPYRSLSMSGFAAREPADSQRFLPAVCLLLGCSLLSLRTCSGLACVLNKTPQKQFSAMLYAYKTRTWWSPHMAR